MAISVDPPDVSRDLSKKAGYTFTILSDPNAEVIRRYDLLHVGGGPDANASTTPLSPDLGLAAIARAAWR